MTKRGFRFEFDEPINWDQSVSGSQFLFRGPHGEELIVSGALLEGEGTEAHIRSARERLIKNGLDAVSKAALHPDLVTIKNLAKDDQITGTGLDSWTIASQTKAGDAQFLQAVISNGWGVLIVTFEAPNDRESRNFFQDFLRRIRNAPVS